MERNECTIRGFQKDLTIFENLRATIAPLTGDMAEIGVWRGRSAREIASTWPQKRLHLFDTFEGMPAHNPEMDNYSHANIHRDTSIDIVKEHLGEFTNVEFHKGLFPETAKAVRGIPFCLVNIDVDIYQSTRDCWEFFYPRMVTGGAIVIYDDYFCSMCRGVNIATDNFWETIHEPLWHHNKAVFVVKG